MLFWLWKHYNSMLGKTSFLVTLMSFGKGKIFPNETKFFWLKDLAEKRMREFYTIKWRFTGAKNLLTEHENFCIETEQETSRLSSFLRLVRYLRVLVQKYYTYTNACKTTIKKFVPSRNKTKNQRMNNNRNNNNSSEWRIRKRVFHNIK